MRVFAVLFLIMILSLLTPFNEKLEFNKGCCYDVGSGHLMKPVYGNYKHSLKEHCITSERIGGATRHTNMSCYELKKIHSMNKKLFKYI